ncbi:hypothetical protein P3T21_007590 [Paraburkholderia sp. GAS334]
MSLDTLETLMAASLVLRSGGRSLPGYAYCELTASPNRLSAGYL